MPAKSKSQQRLFGMVHAYQKGKLKHAPASVKRIAKHISEEDAEHFAKTRHDGLPETKKAEVITMTRYEQGFLTKCAEYGLDADTSVKLMQKKAMTGGRMLQIIREGNKLPIADLERLIDKVAKKRDSALALKRLGVGGAVREPGTNVGFASMIIDRIKQHKMERLPIPEKYTANQGMDIAGTLRHALDHKGFMDAYKPGQHINVASKSHEKWLDSLLSALPGD